MAKFLKDVVQDSPRTGLGILVRTKNPIWRRQRVCALHRPQAIRSSGTTYRLLSWSATGTHWSNHGPKALAPDKSRLDRAFYSARWLAPGLDGMFISRSGHHAILSAISRRVCAFQLCGWPPSRERCPRGLLSRWAPYETQRSPSFPPPISRLAGRSPGPAQHSSI